MNLDFSKNNFDLIRLFAASQVAVVHAIHHFEFHSWTTAFQLLRLFPGVPIFFVISGFLISASFERNPNVVRYFRARALRIFPGLWVCLLFSILATWYFVRFDIFSQEFVTWFASQATFLQFYHPNFLRSFGVGVLNGSLWTIPVEIQFYILLPILYFVAKRLKLNGKHVVMAIIVLALAHILNVTKFAQYDASVALKLFHVSIVPHLYLFLIGVFIQRNLSAFQKMFKDKLLYLVGAYLLLGLLGSTLDIPVLGNAINPISSTLLAIIVILLAYTRVPQRSPLKGYDLSYGVYIYHMVFINIFLALGYASNFDGLVYALLATLVAAYLSWVFVEKQALKLRSR